MSLLPDHLIIDFDSTFCQLESLDELFAISLEDHPSRDEALREFEAITDSGMAGVLPFGESLARRVSLLRAGEVDIARLVPKLRQFVTDSIVRNRDFIAENHERIWIVSSGFRELIVPVVADFGILPDRVLANSFVFGSEGRIEGFDTANPLSQTGGKVMAVRGLELKGTIWVVGDGYTDYEIRREGFADRFFSFGENASRKVVNEVADQIVFSIDEVLYGLPVQKPVSFPKNKIKILLLENIHPHAHGMFAKDGFDVEVYSSALSEDELAEKIKDVSVLGIRSKTQLTAKVLGNASRLMAVGAFCIGTNQIDLSLCTKMGIATFNAPYSNTRSVVELALGEIIMLMRKIPDRSAAMHEGRWQKSAAGSREIRGKRLGIIGYGSIGAQLSVLAEAIGMEVWYYDLAEKLGLGNAKKCLSLETLLPEVDVVTLHVDGREANEYLIGRSELGMMKPGAIFLNLSRGHVVDVDALKENLASGHLGGASVDVFPEEPKNNQLPFVSPLQHLPNTILTPHIGGSTLEAQENIADYVPARLISYINTGDSSGSVNFPVVQLSEVQNGHRLLHIHQNIPGILAKINAVLADHQINILAQYLKTNEDIGYLITDVDQAYTQDTIKALKQIDGTVRFRVLY